MLISQSKKNYMQFKNLEVTAVNIFVCVLPDILKWLSKHKWQKIGKRIKIICVCVCVCVCVCARVCVRACTSYCTRYLMYIVGGNVAGYVRESGPWHQSALEWICPVFIRMLLEGKWDNSCQVPLALDARLGLALSLSLSLFLTHTHLYQLLVLFYDESSI